MVFAWKHMAFIVHIQTICPVYRPKARGSWKCWTHHTCSIVYLGTCRKCIWNFYSAWAVRASEIPDRGNELPKLKFCRGRKCMSTVYNRSMHFHRIRRILPTLPNLLWAEQRLKYTTGREPGPLQPSKKGTEPSNETVRRRDLSLNSQKGWGICDKLISWKQLGCSRKVPWDFRNTIPFLPSHTNSHARQLGWVSQVSQGWSSLHKGV